MCQDISESESSSQSLNYAMRHGVQQSVNYAMRRERARSIRWCEVRYTCVWSFVNEMGFGRRRVSYSAGGWGDRAHPSPKSARNHSLLIRGLSECTRGGGVHR